MKEYVFAKIDFDTAEKVPSKVRTRKYNGLTGNTFLGYNGINPFIRNEYGYSALRQGSGRNPRVDYTTRGTWLQRWT